MDLLTNYLTEGTINDEVIGGNDFGLEKPERINNFLYGYDGFELQLETVVDTDEIIFFHFGCWNKDGCEDNKPFHRIIQSINSDNQVKFGIIAGDNVYQQDIDNKKVYVKEILSRGITCLEELNRPIFATIGYHDIITCEILSDQIDRTKFIMKNGHLEINTSLSGWILPHNYYNLYYHLIHFTVHFIFIDTNLFNDFDEGCYHDILKNHDKLNKMLKWIEHVLDNNEGKHIILVGHTYLFGFAKELDTNSESIVDKEDKIISLINVEKLLNILNKFIKEKQFVGKIYYLCADIHNFQYNRFVGKKGLTIDIIIAGTGGGDPCALPSIEKNRQEIVKDRHGDEIGTLQLIGKNEPYGYLKHTINADGLESEYKKIEI